ncbi:S1 family peptidase [Haloechinothrix halophila]|uniref:S1 family peptidase n=1 Tax=Haloechinothrix halophila TaxID=1069073 RepID=UPI000556DFD5|nr:S1 family peptidase [Haloechinothrix halophila]
MTKRKRHVAARLSVAAMLAAGTAAVLTLPATAEPLSPSVTPTAEADTMAAAMQRDLGLSKQEAKQRLRSEAAAFEADETVRAELKDSFGGSYYDAELGTLVVGVTDRSKFDEVRAAGAQPRRVDDSRSEMDAVVEQLNEADAKVPDAVAGWYVDVEANSVVMTTAIGTTKQARDYVRAAGVKQSDVDVQQSTEDPRTLMDIIGGNAYYNDSTGGRCSVGFSVYGGFVTAGHCGDYGDYTSQPSGYFAGSSFPGDDYAYVDAGSDDTPRPWVNMYNGWARVVQGSYEAPVGSSVCRSGSTTGWHCGYIEAKNQTVSYPSGTVYGLTRTDVCAEPGDSGGSFISGNEAQGMTSGGSGDCTWGGTTYFQPVNEVLNAYGLTLVTG